MTLVATVTLAATKTISGDDIPPGERRSGFDFMSRETQGMQRDDTANPGMLFVGEGETLWNRKEGPANRACADCHGEASTSMRGVAARHPAYDDERQQPVTLEQRINHCRETRQNAPPLRWESPQLLALTAFVAHQSRGLPVTPPDDARLTPFRERGKEMFETRYGQLNLACSNCHTDNWGKRLGGATIPQAHPTGYPIYRLEWQSMGSLQRRLRNCMIGVRSEPFAYGSPEFIALELYLNWRARGLPVEAPGVRP
jgi:sulfur-oxidizing protein SoxA